MSQLALTEILGLLLQDSRLRKRLAKNRTAVMRELGAAQEQASFINGLNLQQLEAQAESLIRKRQYEASRVIPETWSRLGRHGQVHFRKYADQAPWPQGHRRHFIDAAMFCDVIKSIGLSGYLKSEHQRVAFLAGHQRFSIRIVNDLIVNKREYWAIQFCIRRKETTFSQAYHFGCSRKRKRPLIAGLAAKPETSWGKKRKSITRSLEETDESLRQCRGFSLKKKRD